MPIKDFPNSDAQLQQALEAAKLKADATPAAQLAFSSDTLNRLNLFLPEFDREITERGSALTAQATATAAANPARRALNMVNRHFIQVFNFAVERGEWTPQDRGHYQLPVDYTALPKMTTDEENLRWAKNIVDGEAARVAAGGSAMSNPTAADVAAKRAALVSSLASQSSSKDAYDKEQKDVELLRGAAIELVTDIWDEVLFTFRKESASSQRRLAREYGVSYRPSPGETPSADDFSLKGRATEDMTNVPLADVEAYIVELDQYATTDIDGNYYFGLLPAGTYTLRYRKAGYLEYVQYGVSITEGNLTTLDVRLKTMMPPPPMP
jgi:hypothetical protein